MKEENMKNKAMVALTSLALFSIIFSVAIGTSLDGEGVSQDSVLFDMEWVTNFGGTDIDKFENVIATPDGGFVAVGSSSALNGDWEGLTGKGGSDAIIVKFDSRGNVEWKNNFGGEGEEAFKSVTMAADGGFVAVGSVGDTSFGTGDWDGGETGRGGADALIVKFNNAGAVVWKKNFGGSGADGFLGVTATSSGSFIAVGNSETFEDGDWEGITGNGKQDAIIVEYSSTGSVLWKRPFGGSFQGEVFNSTIATPDGGFVTVGASRYSNMGTGDWGGFTSLGGTTTTEATIVKFIPNEHGGYTVEWRDRITGAGTETFLDVCLASDGNIVAVGTAAASSFGNGTFQGVEGRGGTDSIIVKYNIEGVDGKGTIEWKKNFGGANTDNFYGVSGTSDGGFIVTGTVAAPSYGNGDWMDGETPITGYGAQDSCVVKYDEGGNVEWKKNFGGSSGDTFTGVAALTDGSFIAVGYSSIASIGNGTFGDLVKKGTNTLTSMDAILLKLSPLYEIIADDVPEVTFYYWDDEVGDDGDWVLFTSDALVLIANSTLRVKAEYSGSTFTWTGDLAGESEDEVTLNVEGNVTITGTITYVIAYNPNSGTGTAPSQSIIPGSDVQLALSDAFTATGKQFKEWNTQADGGGTAYAAGETVTPSSNITLYAIWLNIYAADGGAGKLTQGSSGGFSVVTEVSSGKLDGVKVNGTLIDPANYTVEGDTTILFSADYIDDLVAGTYDIEIVFTDGFARTVLTVEEGSNDDDDGGIDPVVLGIIAAVIVFIVVCSVIFIRRK